MKASTKKVRGFTLVEIAIVLVIIGLLLGGVLKGQELINTAKVRAIADRQSALKVAWYSFVARYNALPGDFSRAAVYIPTAINGNGDGEIINTESPLAFQHLTASGYIRCAECNVQTVEAPMADNSLRNNYGGVMSIWHDGTHYIDQTGVDGTTKNENDVTNSLTGKSAALQVHTGKGIPSNIISQVDDKIDDGIANTGDFRFNQYDPLSTDKGPKLENCTVQADNIATNGTWAYKLPLIWRPQSASPPTEPNCGASVFL